MRSSEIESIRLPLRVGGYLQVLRLNAPRTLNALTLPMVEALLAVMQSAAADEEAVAVWIEGAGERGFCAGGDVRSMRESALRGGRAQEAERFFETEYRLDYLIHTFPKPVVCWAHGIVMGGGLGLLAGASHRIVTEDTRLAMPEVSIGLYPDVGASWFLPRMPGKSGVFCALTGVSLNPGDALYAGLADYLCAGSSREAVQQQLVELDWQFDASDSDRLTERLTDLEAEQNLTLPEAHLKMRLDLINRLCETLTPAGIDDAFAGLHGDDPWLNSAGESFHRGSASTACLVLEQLHRAKNLSLADVFRLEMIISANRVRDAEFIEGVRAQLVDKDRNPQWRYAQLSEVPKHHIEDLFIPPWSQHPLADLG